MVSARLGVGDVVSVVTQVGIGYLQLLGRISGGLGEAIAVAPRLHATPLSSVSAEAFDGWYVTFYPVSAAIRAGLVTKVARFAPVTELPARYRRPGGYENGRVRSWIIEDREGNPERVSEALSEADLDLPIATIWNHALLVERLAQGWSPRHASSEDAQEARPVVDDGRLDSLPRQVQHLLYARTKKKAEAFAAAVQSPGVSVITRRSATGNAWLVYVTHEMAPESASVGRVREDLERIARDLSLEYDGWEMATGV